MKYLVTYDDALRLCEAYNNFNFYKTEHTIDGYKIVTFNYFICDYNMFATPLEDAPEISAFDMRGVTFVFNKDGSLFKRFLMLPKFFNVNEVETTQVGILKTKKIKFITNKEDGSLIAFMQLPNGKFFAKTQAGFTNEQSLAAMKLYNENEDLKNFVDAAINDDYTPLFEYVAFDNRIVLKYSGRKLCFIGYRDNISGDFYSAASIKETHNIEKVKTVTYDSLDEIGDYMKTAENIEGVVIEFEDGQIVKWKSAWYFNLHGIRTMHIFREDYIIHNYVKETLDDITQELDPVDDVDAFNFINNVKNAVNNWSKDIEKNIKDLRNAYYSEHYAQNWSKFARDNSKIELFALSKVYIKHPEKYKDKKIEYMLKKTYRLKAAINIVKNYESSNIK